jgi:hypothetical protein
MEIVVGLFVGVIILALLVGIYDWVRFGSPLEKRKGRKWKISKKGSDRVDENNQT